MTDSTQQGGTFYIGGGRRKAHPDQPHRKVGSLLMDVELIQRLARGQKVEHRIPLSMNRAPRTPKPHGFVAGRSYTVHRRKETTDDEGKVSVTRPGVMRVIVQKVDRSTLGEVDDAAARREGYDDLETFKASWPVGWTPQRQVWVLSIRPDPDDAPRLMAAQSEYGYTESVSRALEPDAAAPPERITDEYAKENNARHAERTAADQEAKWKETRGRMRAALETLYADPDLSKRLAGELRGIEERLKKGDAKLKQG